VMTQPFSAGRHTIGVALADGAVVERVRIERKKDGATDYVATVRRLGLDLGPDGPVTWEQAAAASRFTADRVRALTAGCGDVVLPAPDVSPTFAGPTVTAAPAAATTTGPTNPVPGPTIDTTILPPQQPVSPVQPLATVEVARPGA
jgi:hypothetical protein